MKRIGIFVLLLGFSFAVQAEGLLDRFNDPEKGAITFIEKGQYAWGLSGSYYLFDVKGGSDNDGFQLFSMLNIGEGQLQRWSVSPSFSYILADDLSLGIRLDYDGYLFNAALNLDLRDVADEDDANYEIASRRITNNKWGTAITLRKYLSFFGSKVFGIFGEGRLYGSVGVTHSRPISDNSKKTDTISIKTGLQLAGGGIVKLRDNSAITLSIPLVSIGYGWTKQMSKKNDISNVAYINKFNISRSVDLLAIQIGYVHYIGRKSGA